MQYDLSLSEFFYNIIPGILFLAYMHSIFEKPLLIFFDGADPNVNFILEIVVLAVTLGFLFQMLTKILRNYVLNALVFRKIAHAEENKKLFDQTMKDLGIDDSISEERKFKAVFYTVDSFLRAANYGNLSLHFSSRFAFWSNMFFGSVLVTIVLMVFSPTYTTPLLRVAVLFTVPFSALASYEYMYALYDSSLRAFGLLRKVEKNKATSSK